MTKYFHYDADAHSKTFLPFSMVVLVSQLLQLWHASHQIIAVFRWQRSTDAAVVPPV